MKQLPIVLILLFTSNAHAWNDRGHMVVARIAWKELAEKRRAKVIAILKSHPHYEEFLKADRPDNIPEDEWVFMRAATWADWVRNGPAERKAFNRPEDHYVNFPVTKPGDPTRPPSAPGGKILQAIPNAMAQMKSGGDRVERAVAMTWIFHLVGDIHQPLHCVAMYSETFPKGDRGGNLALVRIKGEKVQLHYMWDGLLGSGRSLSDIGGSVFEIEQMLKKNPTALGKDIHSLDPTVWAKESVEAAKRFSYWQRKDVQLWPANSDGNPEPHMIPEAPERYAQEAGEVARYRVAAAGKRLANVIEKVLPGN